MEHKTIKLNNIDIDRLIVPIIKHFWRLGGQSFECCQGGKISSDEAFDNPNCYLKNGKYYEFAWIIINKTDINKIVETFSRFGILEFHTIFGTNGYLLEDYHSKEELSHINPCFVSWKRV